MFGHYYTALHDYCQQYGYPIPSSEWRQVQSEGEEAFVPVRRHVESISMIQKGRAVKQPFHSRPDSLQTKTVSHSTPSGITKNGALPPPVPGQQQQQSSPTLEFSSKPTRTTSNTSYTSYNRPSPPASTASFHTANASEYFSPTSGGANRQGSQPPTPYLGTVSKTPSSASLASAAAAIAVKKKPPPPPSRKTGAYPATPVSNDIKRAEQELKAEQDAQESERLRME